MKAYEIKLKEQKVFAEQTSIVAQLVYRIQTFLANNGDLENVEAFLDEQQEIVLPNTLQYMHCFYDQTIGTCGATFLDSEREIYIVGYSGTNIIANKSKDLLTDAQIVLGYPTRDSVLMAVSKHLENKKIETLKIAQKVKSRILTALTDLQNAQEHTPEYIYSAVSYYEKVKYNGKPIILTGHSLGGNIATIVALTVNHEFTITYNSAPLYVVDEHGTYVQNIQQLLPKFTGNILRFVAKDDPLNLISEALDACYTGKKIIVEQHGFHAMIHFFNEKSQKIIENEIENQIAALSKNENNV